MAKLTEKTEITLGPKVPCSYKENCTGCQYLDFTYSEQVQIKKDHLNKLFISKNLSPLEPIEFVSAGEAFLRDRLDFSLQDSRLGLYDKDRKNILDLEVCAQLSPALQEWLTEFRKIRWPFAKGSIRLRVGPEGQKGVWLDFANVDIKALLEEQNILKELQKVAFVEIGQRRKVPFWTGTEFKLRDPQLNVWFQTWLGERAVDLYCQIASFTQPSLKANKLICATIADWVQSFPRSRVLEFGSGIGNLTLPTLCYAENVVACEIDELSLQGLQKSLDNLPGDLQPLKNKITIHRGDFQKKLTQDFSSFDGILANPPRSGLMNFLTPLEDLSAEQRPQFFIYMSCFPESMVEDFARLSACGYTIQKTLIVDQFPQTAHYEVLSLLQRK
ncbi:MAG: class I SAM-dependent RNA methyltransferase [Bdellovibrio sp.]|nr:class I SAM-dependent RNA methyltransferase [Bdellovibrio sp.]